MSKISFKPKQKTKKMLKHLQDRSRYVLVNRFGLEGEGDKKTLEAIGQEYGITRERVRQIENFALKAIRKSESFEEAREIFEELRGIIDGLGGIVSEEELLQMLSKDAVTQNHIHLYLTLGDDFSREKENSRFKTRWVTHNDTAEKVHSVLDAIHKDLTKHDLIAEEDLIQRILDHNHTDGIHDDHMNEETVQRWLRVSKALRKNPLNEWGRHDSPNVSMRGVKDYAFLVMRKHGSPLHFREVAEAIEKTFDKKTHVATCHNELIKDNRFVLVGRGVYALKEWGYRGGVVREVIQDILAKHGPLSKQEIVDKVLQERYLKKNTILVNLQNSKYFRKDNDGLYHLVEEETKA